MNNNKTDEAALIGSAKGVFCKTSYISIGTKENPEPYGLKDKARTNYTGKQFITTSSKSGKIPDTFFERKHLWIFDGDKFIDRTKYAEVQQEKKKGFLTGDFHKRDEFSNTIRTEQWREQLQQEKKFANQLLTTSNLDNPEIHTATNASTRKDRKKYLYDLVFEKPDMTANGASRTKRDTNNPTALSKLRDVGSLRTTYNLTHEAPTRFEKPEFARRPIVRDTFYRKMNVPLSQY